MMKLWSVFDTENYYAVYINNQRKSTEPKPGLLYALRLS